MTTPSNKAGNGSTQTDAQNAILLCSYSELTNPGALSGYMKGWEIVWKGTESKDGNYAFIATDAPRENYVMTIAGSLMGNLLTDWDAFANWVLEDFNVFFRKKWSYATTPNAHISAGADLGFTNVLNMQDSRQPGLTITDYLVTNAIKKGKKVIITGHSLGGNIANVFASYFISYLNTGKLSTSNVSLYTFAAPAPGNADFATDLDAKLPNAWHYQSALDIIPHFPVAANIFDVGDMYQPNPAASAIKITYQGKTMTLREGILVLGGILLPYNYTQQANNYTIFNTAKLNSNFKANTMGDWLKQLGSQHAPSNYADYLRSTLTAPSSQYA
jgi:triacylglycerol lipase